MAKQNVNEKELEADPTKEARAEDCDASPLDCEVPLAQDDRQTPGPSFLDELQDQFDPYSLSNTMVTGSDGLPVQASEETEVRPAPPFHYDTVVCIEDDRQWVEQLDGEPLWLPPGVHRLAMSRRFLSDGYKRRVFDKKDVDFSAGAPFVQSKDGRIPVRPVRPQCEHYKRQLLGNDSQPDPNRPGFGIIFRNCTKRRSIQGADMSVRDEAVYACEHREPYDKASMDKHLIKPDEERLARRPVKLPLFNIT